MADTGELIDAIQRGDGARVAALLDEDRALLSARSGETSAILLALYHGKPDVAQLFAARGAPLTFPEACALGELARVRGALDGDASLARAFSDDGFPALGLAIFMRHPDVAAELIERGADVDAAATNAQRVAPVHAAAAARDHASMRLLLARGADPNARQQGGVTPLHGAASRGDVELAELLLAHGADAGARTDDGRDAADIAEKYEQPAFASWFRARAR